VIRVSIEIREGVLTRCGSWARLSSGSIYVCQLARDLRMCRLLRHMHLKRREAAGLVSNKLEVSDDCTAHVSRRKH
jgi:hypothetical protein